MKIERVTKDDKGESIDPINYLELNMHEAHMVMQSIATSLADGNPNSGRAEFYLDNGEYFTIFVQDSFRENAPVG